MKANAHSYISVPVVVVLVLVPVTILVSSLCFEMGFYQWRDRAKALSSHTLLMSRLYAQFKYWTESERGLYLYGLFYPLELKAILCLPQREHLSLKCL